MSRSHGAGRRRSLGLAAIRSAATALAVLLAGAAAAQSFQWRDVVQDVTIQPDGQVVVDDTRTLWTDGDFGEAFICVELENGQSLTLLDGSGALGPGPSARAFSQPCEAGTEVVVHNDQRVSERRVRFVYRLSGTVEPFSDVVQWYWNLVQLDHPPVLGYRLTVHAPGPMAAPFDAYVHRYANPEQPVVSLSDDRSTLNVRLGSIPKGDGVEVRYLMDPALFSVKGSRAGFQRLLQDETRIAKGQSRARALDAVRGSIVWAILPLLALVWLATRVWGAYNRYGREPSVPSMKYPFEPPSDLPPAAVTAARMQTFSAGAMGSAFHATIMDLARRGYGEFTPKGKKFEMRLTGKAKDGLLPFEADVLGYLESAARTHRRGDPSYLEFSELKAYSQSHASSFMQRWSRKVRAWLEDRWNGPLVSEPSRKATRLWAGRGVLVALALGAGAVATVGAARAAFIAGAVLAVVCVAIAGASLPAWREDLAPEIYGWNGFKRTLTDYTRMKDAPLDFFRLWDVYYCYAAALGVAAAYLKTLQRAAPLAGVDEGTMLRSGAWMGAASAHDLASLSTSVSSLSSALSAASASASSGGSSGGGGGGGGGGGSSGGR